MYLKDPVNCRIPSTLQGLFICGTRKQIQDRRNKRHRVSFQLVPCPKARSPPLLYLICRPNGIPQVCLRMKNLTKGLLFYSTILWTTFGMATNECTTALCIFFGAGNYSPNNQTNFRQMTKRQHLRFGKANLCHVNDVILC